MKTAEELDKTKVYKSPSMEIISAYVNGEWKQFYRSDIVDSICEQKLAEMPSKKDKNEYLRNQELADKYDKALFDLGFNSCFDWLKSLTESKQKDTNQ